MYIQGRIHWGAKGASSPPPPDSKRYCPTPDFKKGIKKYGEKVGREMYTLENGNEL